MNRRFPAAILVGTVVCAAGVASAQVVGSGAAGGVYGVPGGSPEATEGLAKGKSPIDAQREARRQRLEARRARAAARAGQTPAVAVADGLGASLSPQQQGAGAKAAADAQTAVQAENQPDE